MLVEQIECLDGCIRMLVIPASAPAQQQAVVFPHAGGTFSFYKDLRRLFPASVDLVIMQYPGREERSGETMWQSPEEALTEIVDGITSTLGLGRIRFFGHSMGAMLAVHTALALSGTRFAPEDIAISSQMAPRALYRLLKAPDAVPALTAELLALDEASAQISYDALTRPVIEARLAADLALLRKMAAMPVTTRLPLRFFGGSSDPFVSRQAGERWAQLSSIPLKLSMFDGGHFYLSKNQHQWIEEFLSQP